MKEYNEFIGLPGSGKSTLQHRIISNSVSCVSLHSSFEKIIIDVFSCSISKLVPHRLLSKLAVEIERCRIKLFNPSNNNQIAELRALVKHIEENDEQAKKYIRWCIRDLVMIRKIQNANINQTVLNDEGFLQRTLGLFDHSNKREMNQLDDYLNIIPQPDHIIYVNTEPSNCLNRLEERERGPPTRYAGLSVDELVDNLIHMDIIIERVLTYFKKKGVPVLEIDNNGGLIDSHNKLSKGLGL